MSTPDPLDEAREAALRHFSQMLLFVFFPVFALFFVLNWQDLLDEPLRLPTYILIPLVGVLMRPAPARPLMLRGKLATWAMAAVTVLTLLKTGVRQPYSMIAIVMTFMMAVLFGPSRDLFRWAALLVIAGALGLVLRAFDVIAGVPGQETAVINDLMSLILGTVACAFIGMVLQSTLRIYREANSAQHSEHEQRLEAERKAQTLQRQELVATMARGMAHDLANVIQVVNASVELMRDSDDHGERRRLADDASSITARAARTLRALLTVGKVASSADGHTDIGALFERLTLLVGPVVGSRIEVAVECHATGAVAMNSGRLEQVLLNLAFNARDAMPGGGRLVIKSEREPEPQSGDGHGRAIMITVSDTGVGIPPELLPRVFDPYVTTKGAGEGTGLGLAIVARAVEDAGGTVHVTSSENSGTTFSLRLPAR